MTEKYESLKQEIYDLKYRVQILEHKVDNNKLPQSYLFSDSFLKRSFSIWLHYAVSSLIIGVIFYIIIFFIIGINMF